MTDTVYHLVGSGGIGMSAIARLLLARGVRVSGSDVRRTPLLDRLEREGMRVAIGHDAANVAGADVVVVSSAIALDNPELVAALEGQIEVVTRGKMLARLAEGHKLVAVAGTHGKTTTTAMLATIFEAAGLDPTVAVGGIRVDSGTNARAGSGTWFVTESDESDGSFLELQPTIAVVNNIENDHIASDAELPRLLSQFATFVSKVPPQGRAVIGTDNPASALLASEARAATSTFATRANAQLTASGIEYENLGSRFTVCEIGSELGTVELNVPGEINVQNALAAIGAARAAGIGFAATARALGAFHGVERRFQIVGRGALTIVNDYAHHPTAILQTIAAARAFADGAPVIVAFQPHRYTRTQYLQTAFAAALASADRVFLTPIYAASEDPIPGVSARSIGEPLAAGGTPVTYVDDVEALLDEVPRDVPAGALVLMLGAGSISGVAHRLGERISAAPLVR
ncbi:MAG: UDP-N-acetylmuramate--L-alanine ligase [Candidatus Eremiobacteraeota bacterium]|nr:UDP-N-acetylmuramate--L-alanine ligase [Candidatus Eremiobacteraeota bacterium]